MIRYVSMLPTSHATAATLVARKHAFIHRIGTSHWANQEIVIENYGQSDHPRLPEESPPEMLRLVAGGTEGRGAFDTKESKSKSSRCVLS
jgi:hypothetical protein